MFINNKDSKNNNILRKYSYFLSETDKKSQRKISEYAIWSNDFLIAHMRESKYYFIDGTWYKPPGMVQILIILFLDCISNLKIPDMFIVTSSKTQNMHTKVFKSVYNKLNQKHMCILKVKYIITDTEIPLINGINNNIFNNIKKILEMN